VPLQIKLNKNVNKQVPDIAFMSISVMHLQHLILRDSSFFNPVKRKEKTAALKSESQISRLATKSHVIGYRTARHNG